MERYQETAAL